MAIFKKSDFRYGSVGNLNRNEKGTYAIIGEDGEVIKHLGIKQLFRGKAAIDNQKKELQKVFWEELKVVKLK